MQHYLTYLLERGLNTPPFMRRLRKDNRDRDSSGQVNESQTNGADEFLH